MRITKPANKGWFPGSCTGFRGTFFKIMYATRITKIKLVMELGWGKAAWNPRKVRARPERVRIAIPTQIFITACARPVKVRPSRKQQQVKAVRSDNFESSANRGS